MMVSKSMKVLNIIAGVLLMALGVYCLCNQDIAAMTAGLMIGVLMLLSGVMEIVVFATTSGFMLGSGWLLLDGVLTVILSLFLLLNQWFTMMSLPFLFTLWLLFSGVSRFVSAFDLRACGVRGWRMDFGRRRHSDRGRVRLHDGSVGERCGNRRDGRAGLPAGRCQRRGLRLHPARQVSSACLQILLQSKAFQIDIE